MLACFAGGPTAMVLMQSLLHFALLFLCRIKPQGPRSQIMTPTAWDKVVRAQSGPKF